MLRCVLVIPFGWLLFVHGHNTTARYLAAALFVVASITDFLDGAIARKRNLVTSFGKIADPIADKALTGVALIGLSVLGELPWWVTIVMLAREIGVTLIRFWVIRHGVISASRGGKAKTVFQIMAIFFYLLPVGGFIHGIGVVAMAIALALAIFTGIDYFLRALHLRQTSERAAQKRAAKAARSAR